jgi:hypothetical protein
MINLLDAALFCHILTNIDTNQVVILELKLVLALDTPEVNQAFNRTILELKKVFIYAKCFVIVQ